MKVFLIPAKIWKQKIRTLSSLRSVMMKVPHPPPPPPCKKKSFPVKMKLHRLIGCWKTSLGRRSKADRSHNAFSTKIHDSIICTVYIDQGSFFSNFGKAWKNTVYVLNTTLKTRIFTSWNSRQSGCPNFWTFWKPKISTVPIGRYVFFSGQKKNQLVMYGRKFKSDYKNNVLAT